MIKQHRLAKRMGADGGVEGTGVALGMEDAGLVRGWGALNLTPHLPISWGSSAAVRETS